MVKPNLVIISKSLLITNATRAGFAATLDVSAYSFLAVAKKAVELELLADPASLVTLTYMGATRAIPNYNTMGAPRLRLKLVYVI